MSQQLIVCACPQCGTKFRVPAEAQGKKGVCKKCQAHFVLQAATGAAAPAVAAPPGARPGPAAPAAPAPPAVAPLTPSAPPDDPLAPIPLDDAPVSLDSSAPPVHIKPVSDDADSDKFKIQATGHYYVHRIMLSGQFKQVQIEKSLNEFAAEGWRLQQIFPIDNEVFLIMTRESTDEDSPPPPHPSDD